jgi:transcription antitermination factor NusG
MFIHFDLQGEGKSRIAWLPHSRGLVAFGNDPGRVPDSIILAIQKRVDEISSSDPDPFAEWKHGDRAVIREGAFEGFEAIFDRGIPGKQRARVLMKFLSGQWVRTEVDVHLLEKGRFIGK